MKTASPVTSKKTSAKEVAVKRPAANSTAAELSSAKKAIAETRLAQQALAKKASAKKPSAKKSPAKKSPAKKPSAKKPIAQQALAKQASAKKPSAKKPPAKKSASEEPLVKHGTRADLGAPIAGFFAKQPPATRPILEALRELVEAAMPDAHSSIKWGMPFFTIGGAMACALGGHKKHVNLILAGPPGTFADPEGLLSPEVKTGRRLTLSALEELPRKAVQGWLRTAAQLARKQGTAR